MSRQHGEAGLCERVFDRLVEGEDVSGDPVLAEHLGSCVTCFRALTELRDAPRLAEALRGEAPAVPPADDRFWDQLAARTTAAAEAALRGAEQPRAPAPASPPARARWAAQRSRGAGTRIISLAATLAAAAAGFVLVARRPVSVAPVVPVDALVHKAQAVGASGDEGTVDEEADVAELDVGALRRLLDRLGARAPVALTAPSSGTIDAADLLGEDEGRMNDELADLDGTELRRVASSLEGVRW
ncbi:MAG TPA: hypothetical protein VN853_15870 [Polyangia bacterium]|nr:hypothetical protein [Polyangia bacterium]